MQPAEKRWFEKELDGNLWLRKELDLRRKTDTIVGNSEAMDFRKKLIQAELNHRNTRPVKRAIKAVPTQYAAIFVGIIVISSLLLLGQRDIDPSRLASRYVTSYDPATTSRSVSLEDDMAYNTAVDFYNRGDYQNAIIWFNKIVEDSSSDNIKSTFMLGVTRMKNSEYNEAIMPLEKVVVHNDNLFIEDARWFLSICYLNVNDTAKARDILEEIANSDSIFRKKAKRNLRKIG